MGWNFEQTSPRIAKCLLKDFNIKPLACHNGFLHTHKIELTTFFHSAGWRQGTPIVMVELTVYLIQIYSLWRKALNIRLHPGKSKPAVVRTNIFQKHLWISSVSWIQLLNFVRIIGAQGTATFPLPQQLVHLYLSPPVCSASKCKAPQQIHLKFILPRSFGWIVGFSHSPRKKGSRCCWLCTSLLHRWLAAFCARRCAVCRGVSCDTCFASAWACCIFTSCFCSGFICVNCCAFDWARCKSYLFLCISLESMICLGLYILHFHFLFFLRRQSLFEFCRSLYMLHFYVLFFFLEAWSFWILPKPARGAAEK